MQQLPDDTILWDAFRGGDQLAFTTLFTRHYSALVQYGYKFTRDTELVEDCIQDLFVELWKHKKPAPVSFVKGYLLKALKYKLLKQLGKPAVQSLDHDAGGGLFEISHEDFLTDSDASKEKAIRLSKAMQQLTARQKEIIYLKFYQNLEYEELSEVMNINYQASRNLLYQAIRSMKKYLGNFSMIFFY